MTDSPDSDVNGGNGGNNVNEVSQSTRVRFPRISPRAYEHPVDRGAMAALRAVPGVAEVLKGV